VNTTVSADAPIEADSKRQFGRLTFLQNVLKLFSGRAVAGVITLLAAPIIARLFLPEHFGTAALFAALVTIITPVCTLCFDQAVVLPAEDREASGLVSIALAVAVAVAAACAIFVSIYLLVAGGLPLESRLGDWVWMVPAASLLVAGVSIAESWQIRRKRFGNIARADVSQAAVQPTSRIIFGGLFGSSVGALILGYVLGQMAKLWILMGHRIPAFRPGINLSDLASHTQAYRDFPLYAAPARVLRLLSDNLPILLLGFLFSPAAVGFYAMARRLIGQPTQAFVMSVRKVYVQRASELRASGEQLGGLLLKSSFLLAAIGVLPLMILLAFGEDLAVWLLGERWAVAGTLLEILAPWFFAVWITTPSSATLVVMRRQKIWMASQFVLAVLRASVFAVAYAMSLDLTTTIVAFVAVSVSVNVAVLASAAIIVHSEDARRAS